MKRLVSIQDISCIGKCSLTVALPIVSAAGVETAVMPTAVLSTHTAFKGFTFRDLTGDLRAIAEHWKREKIRFDAIYTGYLGSFEQIEIVLEFIRDFRTPETLVFVDPAMGDNGQLYVGFDQAFAREMGRLCDQADVIVPNLTEAAAMLGIPYPGDDCPRAEQEAILRRLCERGAGQALLTGAPEGQDRLGVLALDGRTGAFSSYYRDRIPQNFHGTGDVFASACAGALVRGATLPEAMKLAVDFTVASLHATLASPDHNWYGVDFETALPELIRGLDAVLKK